MTGNRAAAGHRLTAKVATILQAFAGDGDELSLAELSARTGLPSSTVHRVAGELAAHGILERSVAGHYLVGVRLWEISARSSRSSALREIAMPYLQDLYKATGQHVLLAVLDGADALLVEKISGRHAVPTVSRLGGRLPLHASGVGKAILAYAEAEFQERVLAGPLPRLTSRTVTSSRELRSALAEIRRERTAYCHEEVTVGVVSCAAPIRVPDELAVAAVSVVVTADTDVRLLAPAVRTAANDITRQLCAAGTRLPGGAAAIPALRVMER